jgi:hypothetical protein
MGFWLGWSDASDGNEIQGNSKMTGHHDNTACRYLIGVIRHWDAAIVAQQPEFFYPHFW